MKISEVASNQTKYRAMRIRPLIQALMAAHPRGWSCLIALCWGLGGSQYAQAVQVQLVPHWRGGSWKPGQLCTLPEGDSVQVDVLRFYLSRFQVKSGGEWMEIAGKAPVLVDASDPNSLTIDLPPFAQRTVTGIAFCLGLDSATNVSGALEGDLDPSLGMYWAWQSGYINLKVEGHSPQVADPRKRFEFHLGGYLPGQLAVQSILLEGPPIGKIRIGIDLSLLVSALDLSHRSRIMRPGPEAVALAHSLPTIFSWMP